MGYAVGPEWLDLRFRGYNEAFVETPWRIVEVHPILKLTPDFVVTHPMQDRRAGFVGMKLIPETLHGSFGLEALKGCVRGSRRQVQVEGTWRPTASFQLGLVPRNCNYKFDTPLVSWPRLCL